MIGSVRVVAGAAVAIAAIAMAGSAQASFEICNKSSDDITVAFGYREDGEWTSAGWYNIAIGECAVIYDRKLKEQYYYYYAEKVNTRGYWEGDYVFCAIDDAFTIVGDQDCNARGYEKYGFVEVDVGERINNTLDLTD